jgi:hypothetical protein
MRNTRCLPRLFACNWQLQMSTRTAPDQKNEPSDPAWRLAGTTTFRKEKILTMEKSQPDQRHQPRLIVNPAI